MKYFDLTANVALHQLTLRVAFPNLLLLPPELEVLSTVSPPTFREFVLELGKLPSHFSCPSWQHWGDWDDIDKLFAERFAEREDFRLVIRTGKLYDRETLQRHAKERFPLLAERGCIRFETSHLVDQYWR